jgi:predicted MFS family arabinose efflux permease
LFISPVSALVDSSTMHMLGERKSGYGRVRVGGTIGFGVAALAAGWIAEGFELKAVFFGAAILFLVALLISPRLSYSVRDDRPETAPIPIRQLLQDPRWVGFLTLAFAGGMALAPNVSFFYPYMEELGIAESRMGLAFALGTLGEIPILFFGNRLLKRFPVYRLLLAGTAVTGLRLLLFAATKNPFWVFANQLIVNGFAFPVMWLAGVAYADELSPEGMKSTGQGLFTAMVFGFGQAVGGAIGGPLFESVGGRGLNLIFGVAVLATITGVLLATELRKAVARRAV